MALATDWPGCSPIRWASWRPMPDKLLERDTADQVFAPKPLDITVVRTGLVLGQHFEQTVAVSSKSKTQDEASNLGSISRRQPE